jgi:hypothetical protein
MKCVMMNSGAKMNKKFSILIVISLFLLGCRFLFSPAMRSPAMPFFNEWSDTLESNGATIYYSGINNMGEAISNSGGPITGMMSQRLSCSACHGENGSGGTHVMHMQVMDAPDIRFTALSGESQDSDHDNEDFDSHDAYDIETFRLAVVDGKHPNGDNLNADMPRWNLSDQDLEDLYLFMKTLD